MAYDSITNYALIKQLQSIIGAKVNKIYSPTKNEIVLHLFLNDKITLLLNASPASSRVHFIEKYSASMKEPPNFCMLLRKYLIGAVVKDVCGHNFDRVIKITFETINMLGDFVDMSLIIEIMGRTSNIILINEENGLIVDSIRHIISDTSRQVLPKMSYEYPPLDRLNPVEFDLYKAADRFMSYYDKNIKQALQSTFNGFSPVALKEFCFKNNINFEQGVDELSYNDAVDIMKKVGQMFLNLNFSYNIYKKNGKNYDFSCVEYEIYRDLEKVSFKDVSSMIENYYFDFDRINRLKSIYNDLYLQLNQKLNKERNKLKVRKREYENSKNANEYNEMGQLLLSNMHLINKGDKEIRVKNFFDGNKDMTIKLNPALSASQNANKYFKKYNKAINAKKYLENLLKENEEMIYFLESELLYLNNASDYEEVLQIKDTLTSEGIFKKTKKNEKKKEVKAKPLKFLSDDGFEIYVGKNSLDNDYLTRFFSNKDDLWLHTKDIPSSHVIIRTNNGNYSDEALDFASKLCVYYSKGKDSSKVFVDYTYIKFVKKPKGMKEGKVIYTDNKSVVVSLSDKDKDEIGNMARR